MIEVHIEECLCNVEATENSIIDVCNVQLIAGCDKGGGQPATPHSVNRFPAQWL